jgi:hypothetical protein
LRYGTAADHVYPPLSFDFKGDIVKEGAFWRSVGQTEKVFTGHADGRITINIREADDVEREKLRVGLGEAQWTLIGHFRHEIGHYYWDQLIKGRREDESRAIFGNHDHPTYADALNIYYKQGAPADWPDRFVSAYASMHPWEDFAESWATYFDMFSTLDTAQQLGITSTTYQEESFETLVIRYEELGIAFNEINRNLGLLDAVPEVFAAPVITKLQFVHELIALGRTENGALGGQPPARMQMSS